MSKQDIENGEFAMNTADAAGESVLVATSDEQPNLNQPGKDQDEERELQEMEEESTESLGSKLREPRSLISFGIAIFIVIFALRQTGIKPGEIWEQISNANKALFVCAIVLFFLSFGVRAYRWRMMLDRVGINDANGHQMPSLPILTEILVLSWFANCVVPARLGDAYRGHLLKVRNGASFGVTLGTILAERLIDLVVLVIGLLIGGFIVFGTNVPGRAEEAFLIGSAVVGIGVLGTLGLWFTRDRVEAILPDRFSTHFRKLHAGIFDILKRPWAYVALSAVIWISDGARVFLVARSLGINFTFPESSVIGLLSAMVTISPITPAGVGVVETFLVWLLPTNFDVSDSAAGAFAVLDRFATYWMLIIVGIPLYLYTVRRDLAAKNANNQLTKES